MSFFVHMWSYVGIIVHFAWNILELPGAWWCFLKNVPWIAINSLWMLPASRRRSGWCRCAFHLWEPPAVLDVLPNAYHRGPRRWKGPEGSGRVRKGPEGSGRVRKGPKGPEGRNETSGTSLIRGEIMYTHMHIRMCAHTYIHTCIHTYKHKYTYLPLSLSLYIIYVSIYIYIYAYIYT